MTGLKLREMPAKGTREGMWFIIGTNNLKIIWKKLLQIGVLTNVHHFSLT